MAERTCLITGGGGNLACQLTHRLRNAFSTIVLADLKTGPVAQTAGNCAYRQADLGKAGALEGLLEDHRPTAVYHLASLLSTSSEENRALAWRINADLSFRLFEGCLAHGVRQVFFPSTFATYGGTIADPLPEDFPQWPDGIYGAMKVAVERLGVYYHRTHGLDFRSVRLPVVISPYAPAGASTAFASRMFVEVRERGAYTCRVAEDTRVSTIAVEDALDGISQLMQVPEEPLTRRVYNLHALAPTAGEIADLIRARRPDAAIRFDPDPVVSRLVNSFPAAIDDTAARRDWGWNPPSDLSTIADRMLTDAHG
ncbi:MAG: NAD-dependent epimerase/dehydratase family protein [Opitutales bacterium]